LKRYQEYLMLPTWHAKADPSWFALPLLVRPEAPFMRHELTRFLEINRVQTRLIFAGTFCANRPMPTSNTAPWVTLLCPTRSCAAASSSASFRG
jgi:hypothetical protein